MIDNIVVDVVDASPVVALAQKLLPVVGRAIRQADVSPVAFAGGIEANGIVGTFC